MKLMNLIHQHGHNSSANSKSSMGGQNHKGRNVQSGTASNSGFVEDSKESSFVNEDYEFRTQANAVLASVSAKSRAWPGD